MRILQLRYVALLVIFRCYYVILAEVDFIGFVVDVATGSREKRIAELEAQIEKMKKYIKACWVEENLNDYSSYITNTTDEFRDLVKELNDEVRNWR